MISPTEFTAEYVSFDDEEKYLEKYVKNDIIKSFVFDHATIYNYDLDNELLEKIDGELEVYIAHPYNDGIKVKYSDFMSARILYTLAFYMYNAKIEYKGIPQDFDEETIEIQVTNYNRIFLNRKKAYAHLCNSPSKNGGIIIEAEKDQIEEFMKWNYFVIHNYKYDGPKVKFETLYRRLQDEAMNEETHFDESKQKRNEVFVQNEVSAEDELQSLIGMANIKQDVKSLVNLVRMQKIRQERGLKAVPISLHLVFTGNPGTGKTTVARILAKIYKSIGVLSEGQLVEVDRSGLVAGYVGQTAIKTQEKINEAKGGILFIDEAYSLAKDRNDYGQEAIDTILKAMEDNRDNFIVIVAGYPDLMDNFINSNPGLKSRFNKYIEFPDYNVEELEEIFLSFCKKYEYNLTNAARSKIREYIIRMVDSKDASFANARDIRNIFEKTISNQANRIMQENIENTYEVMTITDTDISF